MVYDSTCITLDPEAAYRNLLDALPGHILLLRSNAPNFTIVAVSPDHLKLTGNNKEKLIGKGLFEVYPSNPDDAGDIGAVSIRASLEHVLKYKESHQLPILRYDMADEHGRFIERYWKPESRPVFNESGDVILIVHTSIEVTDQVKAREVKERMKGMELVERLFLQAPIAINILKSRELIIELANGPCLEIWGKTAEDVLGKSLLDVLPELKSQGYQDLVQQIMETGEAHFVYEKPVELWQQGIKRLAYFNWVIHPYYEKDNPPASGVITFGSEVTGKVMAEKKMGESEEKYRTLFESVDQGFCVIEMIFDENRKPVDYRFLEVNPVFEQQTGLKDATGKTIREFAPNHEDYWFDIYGKVSVTGKSIRFIERAESLNRWYDVYAFPIGTKEIQDVAVLFTDISERKKAEEALKYSEEILRRMILQAPVAICIFRGNSFVIEIANQKMFEFWGKPSEDVIGKPLFEALPDTKNKDYEELLQHVLSTGQPCSAIELPVTLPRHGMAEKVFMNFTYEPLRESDGTISGVMALATDVTDQVLTRMQIEAVVEQRTKELAETNAILKITNKELQRSNSNLEEFAHAASHDLKEPIRKIQFFTNLLKEQLNIQLKEDQARSFSKIENATERMGNLIDDLLIYSHVSQREHESESIDLNQKVQNVLEDLDILIQEKTARIKVGKLPVVQGYRRQLQQLFQNLISNALKYSKADESPLIEISGRKVTRHQRTYNVIDIKDNGIGFEQHYSDKIFQMFARLHGKQEYSGTGVGLSIVKKVVENHHGFIDVESTPGKGSTFSVYLPVNGLSNN